MTVTTHGRRKRLHRRGLSLEWFTVTWNVVEAGVAIGLGLVVGSVALVGFGVDSGAVEARSKAAVSHYRAQRLLSPRLLSQDASTPTRYHAYI